MKKNIKLFILKTSIDNLMVAIAMSFLAGFLSYDGTGSMFQYIMGSASTWYCIPFSFGISWILTLVIPSAKIGNWFARLIGFESESGKYIIGNLFTNIYITLILSFACKMLVFMPSFDLVIENLINTFVASYFVSYIVYMVTSIITSRLCVEKEEQDIAKNAAMYKLDKSNN